MNKKINFIKKLDPIFGPIAAAIVKLLFHPGKVPVKQPDSILFIRPGGIGDAVLLLPSIQAVKKTYPHARIDILAEKRNSEVFSLCLEIDNVFLYDRPTGLLAAIRGGHDVVIDTEQWYRLSAVIAYLTAAPVRVGFSTNERGRLFDRRIGYSHDDYEVSSFLNLLSPIVEEAPFNRGEPFIAIPHNLSERVKPLLMPVAGRKIVAIFPGGSVEEKRWGGARFHETAERLAKRGYGIVVVGGKEDIRAGSKVANSLPDSVNLCGKLSLTETAAVLKEVSLLITGDSGIMHIACGLGTKTVSIFGPGNEKKWAAGGNGNIVVGKDMACRPCSRFGHTPGCKRNVECMKLITVDEVYDKAIELLEG